MNMATEKHMNKLETERLQDFKRILTYHLVTKIRHSFKGSYTSYYAAPKIWAAWKSKKIKYDAKIYRMIVAFNQTGLSAHQVQSIFGKDSNNKWISYGKLISSDIDIKIFNKGTVYMNDSRYQIKKRYQLPFELIKSIFDDENLLAKVVDAGSDYYTDRQRRLIFTQINDKKKHYHYKTKQEKIDEMTDQEKIDALLADMDFEI